MNSFSSSTPAPRRQALITGASRGIGRAIAKAFAQAGYDLALTCSNSYADLCTLRDALIDEYKIRCTAFLADAGEEEAMAAVFQSLDRLDVLVNNAGISHIGLLSDMSSDDWHRVIRVNLDSCFYTCRAAIPLMLREHSGRIINISSVWGNVGASMEVAYSASKGGINAFTRALAKELAPSGICVNAIAPGVIDTDMNACLGEEDRSALIAEIPADRMGTAQEVAQLALSLAQSPAYLTGQILTMDGGWT